MTPRPDTCHRCGAQLPRRPAAATATQRLCRACASTLSPKDLRSIEQADRARNRQWSERDVATLLDAARNLVRATAPPKDAYRAQWIACIDAIDRAHANAGKNRRKGGNPRVMDTTGSNPVQPPKDHPDR